MSVDLVRLNWQIGRCSKEISKSDDKIRELSRKKAHAEVELNYLVQLRKYELSRRQGGRA